MENKNENKKTNTEITEELIYKCEKTRKNNSKKDKPLTDNDIMKYEIASELGLIDKVSERGWAGLTAKEAGKIVILDDNFNSIKDAILYGRTIFHNILKFCKFQLVINVAAVLVSAIAPFFGVDEPLKVTHLLFVNLVMDGLGAMMLGNEPALPEYMDEAPRKRTDPLVSRSMMYQIGIMGIWLTVLSLFYLTSDWTRSFFETDKQFLTSYFVLFIASALFNGFNVRDDGFRIFGHLKENPDFLKVFFLILFIQFAIINVSLLPVKAFTFISAMFSCVPFGVRGWLLAYCMAFTMIPVDMIRKAVMRIFYK